MLRAVFAERERQGQARGGLRGEAFGHGCGLSYSHGEWMYKGRNREERVEFRHTSVLLFEAVESLQVSPDGIYVDGTLGGGGHSFEIARRLSKGGKLIGIDQDAAAVEAAGKRLGEFGNKVIIIRANYAQMEEKLGELGVSSVDGILLDLGVSSNQLDDAKRGFTYRDDDAPLDMSMDTEAGAYGEGGCEFLVGGGSDEDPEGSTARRDLP